jgi:hypothetical protein
VKRNVEQMRQHVLDLCATSDIVLNWCNRPSQAVAFRELEEISIPPIKSALSYATALHEIGHIKGQHQRSQSVMVRERWAWEWARSNALIWTPAMQRSAEKSLAWYLPRAAKLDRSL